MQSWVRNISLAILALVALRPTCAQDLDVNGIVRDTTGHPLAGVLVVGKHHGQGDDEPRTKTDDQGRFELKGVGRVIFFIVPKFQPVTFVRGVQQTSCEVTMKADPVDHWPATCSAKDESGKRYGYPFRFLVPRRAKIRKETSTDVASWTVKVPQGETHEHIVITTGPLLGDGFPPEEWIIDSKDFSERDSGGLDWSGTTKGDKKWRWFSSSEAIVSYENASDGTAVFFDRIIDSVCMSPPGKR